MARQKIDKNLRKDKEWLELCEWLEINIFNYDIAHGQRLKTNACLVLKGLQKGKAVATNLTDDECFYPFNVILLTFKANKTQIQNAIRNKNFDDERKKMTYICAIIEDKLNDIYTRYLNAQKTKEKVEAYDSSVITNEGAKYQNFSENKKKNKRLEELW